MITSREIVFVDQNVSDLSSLLAGLRPDVEPIVLNASERATAQIAAALKGRDDVPAVHVIAHGSAGEVSFAAGALSLETLADHAAELAAIGRALGETGDLLLWSCNTAQGERGGEFVNELAHLVAANVAAASGRVGAEARGGRWELDARADVRAPLTAQGIAAYQGVMSAHPDAVTFNAIINDTGFSPTDFITNDNTITLSGTVEYHGSGDLSFDIYLVGGEFGAQTLVGTLTLAGLPGGGTQDEHEIVPWTFNLVTDGIPAAQELGDGTYTITFITAGKNLSQTTFIFPTANDEFTIDTVGPSGLVTITSVNDDVPAITGGVSDGGTTNDAQPTISGTAPAGEFVAIYDNGTFIGSATADGSGNWSFTPSSPLADGSHSFTGTVSDIAGNEGEQSDPAFDITVDTTPPVPTISVDDITADNVVSAAEAGGTIAVTGTVGGDAQDGDTVTLTVNGNDYTGTVLGGAFSIDVAGSDLAADGNQTVDASVATADAAGNTGTGTDTQTYTVDTTADEGGDLSVTINDGGDGFINDAEDGAVSYTVAGVDGDATETVTFTSSGGGTPVVVSGLGNGTFSVDLSGLNDGTVTATISATDGLGNTDDGAGDTSILDTTIAATITLDDITADNLVSAAEAGGNVAVTGTVGGDVQDGDTVTLTVNGTPYTGAVSGGAFSIDVAGSDLVDDADHAVEASVTTTDVADNSTTATDTQEYQVDATADEGGDLSVVIDDGGDGFINDAEDGAVSYTVAGVDADATAEVTFTSSGGGTPVVVSGLGNGTFVVDLSGLDDGTVTAAISASDGLNTADGSGDTSILDTIVTAAITLDDITADNVLSAAEAGGNVAVTGTVGGDVQDGDTVTLTVNGNDYTGAVSGGAFSIDVAGSDLETDGDLTVEASVTTTDAADNSATASDTQEYQVDATADEGGDLSVVINDGGDGFINDAEDDAVSYTVAGVDGDATATVTFTSSGGGTSVVVSGLSNGAHTIDLSTLGNGTVTAAISATDTLGNTDDGSGDTSVLDTIIAAGITLDDVTADNEIDFFEESGNVAVTGTVGGDVQDGDTVTLTVNGTDYTGAVSGGAFSIDVAGSDLVADLDQAVDASVTATDAAGNTETATDTQAYDVDTTPPGPSAVPLEDVIWVHDDRTVSTATTILGVLGATTNLATRGDFDGDGDDDIALYTDATHVTYWELQDGHFVQAHDLADASRTWSVVGSGDFDADGDDDILWHNENGLVVTWEMQDGAFLQHHHLPVDDHNADIDPTFGQPDTWEIQGTGDFDGDGDDDILWRHQDGLVATWEMQDGLYVVNHNLPAVPTTWEIAGAADVDRDGDADIVWRHEEGLVVVWEMEDGAYVVNHNLDSVPANLNFQGAADFDDDGDNDLLWRQDDGTVVTWTMENGAHVDTTSYGIIDNAWHIRTTGEFPLA